MQIISKLSAICWGALGVFGVLFLLMAIENSTAFGIVWMLLGGILILSFALRVNDLRQQGGFDLNYFLAVQRGYIYVFIGLAGLLIFSFGALRFFAPQFAEQLLGKYIMSYAAILVFLFWAALILMFLGFALKCFSESVGYLRLKKIKDAVYAFGSGAMWAAFMLVCCSLSMDVINENLLYLSAQIQNWILLFCGLVTAVTGLIAGRYEDLKVLSEENNKTDS
jgi:hypothetical protein